MLAIDPQAVVVLVTAHSDVELAVEAMKKGAADFVTKPWENERLVATLMAALNLRRSRTGGGRPAPAQPGPGRRHPYRDRDDRHLRPAMLKVFGAIRRAAPTEANVLILGENGTGKELVAREIHRLSARANEVFLRVDMGALSPQLFESELFGHRRGAFTDAKQDRTGFFRAATGGTLFLDEIGNVPLHLQSKLLTALERREVVPVGARKARTDRRAADLRHQSGAGKTGRMKTCSARTCSIASTRWRSSCRRCASGAEDIPLLLEHYAALYAQKYNLPPKRLSAALIDRLADWSWPGNVRALRHAVERAVILSEGDLLGAAIFLCPMPQAPQDTPGRGFAAGCRGKDRHHPRPGEAW